MSSQRADILVLRLARIAAAGPAKKAGGRACAQRLMREVLGIAYGFSPRACVHGPDCIAVDLHGTRRLLGSGLEVGVRLLRQVDRELGVKGAIGLAGCAAWARFGAMMVRPGSMLEVMPGMEVNFLAMVPPVWLAGVGPKTLALLREMNITNLAMLRDFCWSELCEVFGSAGQGLYAGLHPPRFPQTRDPACNPKPFADDSVSVALEITPGQTSGSALDAHLARAVRECGVKLRESGCEAGHLRLHLQYRDGARSRAAHGLGAGTALDSELLKAARSALARACQRRVMVAGLRLVCTDLHPPTGQLTLFASPWRDRENAYLRAMDRIAGRFGPRAIMRASEMPRDDRRQCP